MSINFVPPIHGNYRGYYTKRQSFHDPRLALLPRGVLKDARVLDVGCNEGWVTCKIAQHHGVKEVIGVDIDDGLVRAAWRHRRTAWSQHPRFSPSPSPDGEEDPSPSEEQRLSRPSQSHNGHKEPVECEEEHTFPAAFEYMFGALSIPPAETPEERAHFPHNVLFRTADWPRDGVIDDRDGYDVVLAFSVTKWIHLNEGDEGLLAFFRRVFSVLRPSGVFILEPQEWESYHKAKRMDPKLKKNSESLRLRPTEFERELIKIGFCSVEHLGQAGKGGFERPLSLYRK